MRLVTSAPSVSVVQASTNSSEGEGQAFAGTAPTVVTDRVRTTGLPVWKASAQPQYMPWQPGFTLGRSYWARMYFQVDVLPTSNTIIFAFNNGTTGSSVRMKSGGVLSFFDDVNAEIITGPAVAADTWVMLEVRCKLAATPTTSNGEVELWVNGTQAGSTITNANLGTTNWNAIRVGWQGTTGLTAMWWTDVALNDDQGATQNGRPGEGTVRYLRPVADIAANNWTNGGGAGTSLYDAVNNDPPTGVASASSTATTQIKCGFNGTSSYEVEVQDYDTAGVPSTDVITVVAGMARVGTSDTTSTNAGTLRLYSNPDVGADTTIAFDIVGANADAEPTGWRTYKTTYGYAPSVTRSTRPRLRISKTTASTRVMMSDYMAVVVESQPSNTTAVADSTRQALYTVFAEVADSTRQALYTEFAQVADSTRQMQYAVGDSVTSVADSTRQYLFAVTGPVANATREYDYNINQDILYPSPNIYPAPTLFPAVETVSPVADSTRDIAYTIKATVADATRQSLYTIFVTVPDSTRQELYTILVGNTPVADSTRQYLYGMSGQVADAAIIYSYFVNIVLIGQKAIGVIDTRLPSVVATTALQSRVTPTTAVHLSQQIQYNVYLSVAVNTSVPTVRVTT